MRSVRQAAASRQDAEHPSIDLGFPVSDAMHPLGPCIDLAAMVSVVPDGHLDATHRDVQVVGCGLDGVAFVLNGFHHLPDVETRSRQLRSTPCRSIDEDDACSKVVSCRRKDRWRRG